MKKTSFLISLMVLFLSTLNAQNFNLDTNAVYDFPLVFHVVHNGEKIGSGSNISDEEIYKMVDRLNKYFRGKYDYTTNQFVTRLAIPEKDNLIQFHIADRDENCNYTTGINRVDGSTIPNYKSQGMDYGNPKQQSQIKDLSKWNTTKYINVWIVNEIYNGANAYASMPSNLSYNKYHGIVFGKDYLEDDLHEFSHFLGLTHEDMDKYGFTSQGAINIHRKSIQNYLYPLISSPICTSNNSVDVAVLEFNKELKGYHCEETVTPQIKVGNYGANQVTDITFNLYKNKTLVNSLNWKGNLAINSSQWVSLDPLKLSKGVDTFEVRIIVANDQVNSNNSKTIIVKTVPVISNSYTQNFENTQNLTDFLIEKSLLSKITLKNNLGVDGSSSMVFEGDDNTSTYFSLALSNAFEGNLTSVSTASVCIDATNLSDVYLLYSKKMSNSGNKAYSNFRVRANNLQWTETARNLTSSKDFTLDTVNLSSFKGTKILVHLDASCRYGSTKGDYISLDNIQLSTSQLVKEPLTLAFKANKTNIFKGDRVTYTNLTKGRYLPVKYKWVFNGGNIFRIDDKMLPSFVSYMDTGEFTSKLITEDINGKKDSVVYEKYIKVVPLISDFTFLNTQTEAYINDKDMNDASINVIVPKGTDLTHLVAQFKLFDGIKIMPINNVDQVIGTTPNDFSKTITYRFIAPPIPDLGSDVFSYVVNVTIASDSAKNMLSFELNEPKAKGVIKGDSIFVNVPYGTDIKKLTSTFTTSIGSTVRIGNIDQISGVTKNDFTNPLVYSVVAADKSIKNYIVKVKVQDKLSLFSELKNDGFQVYPNPTKGLVFLNAKAGPLFISITNLQGREVYRFDGKLDEDKSHGIQLDELGSSLYFIKAINNGISINRKLELID